MKLTFEHSVIAPIISDLASVARGPSPAARAIRFVVKDGTAALSSSDGECWLDRKIECDGKPWSFGVDAPVLQSVIAGCLQGSQISMTEDGNRLLIKSGRGSYRLPLIDPGITSFKPDLKGEPFALPAADLKSGIKVTIPAVSDPKDPKPYKHGVHMMSIKDRLRFTSGDGNRIAIAEVPILAEAPAVLRDKGIILPSQTCKTVLRLIGEGSIGLRITGSLIEFDLLHSVLTSKLIDADYPSSIVEKLIKVQFPNILEIPVPDMLGALNRLMPLADTSGMNGGRALHFRALNDELALSVVSDIGAAKEIIQVETPKAISLGLNAVSLKMALAAGSGNARFEFHDDFANNPCRLTFSDSPGQTWILSAVRVNEPMMAEAA
jgi:DNA polymerase III sliding clamp (beta) subunit (PCNA family)